MWYFRRLWCEITDHVKKFVLPLLPYAHYGLHGFDCTVVSWADSSGFGLLFGCGCLSYEQLVWLQASTNAVDWHPILPFPREHCQHELMDSQRFSVVLHIFKNCDGMNERWNSNDKNRYALRDQKKVMQAWSLKDFFK